jgi:hypothetical protein
LGYDTLRQAHWIPHHWNGHNSDGVLRVYVVRLEHRPVTWVACNFDNDATTCQRCGFVAKTSGTRKSCTPKHGLGDMVASGLSAIGITKERVSKLAGGDCGCAKRQAALNELGRKIGIG